MTLTPLHLDAVDGGTLRLALGETEVFEPSRLFALELDGRPCDSLDAPHVEGDEHATVIRGAVRDSVVAAAWSATEIAGPGVWELALTLTNTGTVPVTVTRMDPISAQLASHRWSTLHFRSAWGDEFRPEHGTTDSELRIESRSGRSSHGANPWLGLERPGAGVIVAPAWSGNWHIDVTEGGRLGAGISTWQFATELAPGASVTAPSVVVAVGDDLDSAALTLTSAIGRAWIPRSSASDAVPVEWNHWWPYEDAEVTEDVIWQNAAIAADLGIGVSTVDAGWFGDADAASDWQEQRGDWHLTNTARFPSGLAALGAGIRERGTKAGIWLEAEAVGASAKLRVERPGLIAHAAPGWRPDSSYRVTTVSLDADDPSFLGYVCMGSPEGREHVARALDTVIRETGAEWIKLDFNIDPDSGCARSDHGHGAHDGLFRHYEGLYRVLDEFRVAHPDVILEACSSGGLRIDLGLARHVHCLFLSDPDYTEHHLQVVWGASLMLPPAAMLHWSWSQWRGDYPPAQLDFSDLDRARFDTLLRAAMLHRFGVSLRLPELSAGQLESVRWHVELFTGTLAPFVRDGVLHRLTAQPLRAGGGERSPAFQLSLGDRHMLFAFRLSGSSTPVSLAPKGLDPAGSYRVTDLELGSESILSGSELMSGTSLADAGRSSWLVLIDAL